MLVSDCDASKNRPTSGRPMMLGGAFGSINRTPFRCGSDRQAPGRFGPTTPKQLRAVTAHHSMVASIQTRVKPRGHFLDASVDPTEARNTIRQAESPSSVFL